MGSSPRVWGDTMMRMLCVAMLAMILCACVPAAPLVKHDIVEVAKYTRQPVDAKLTAPIVVDEPKAECNDGVSTVYCNGQLSAMRLMYQAALKQCNDDRTAIRNGQADEK